MNDTPISSHWHYVIGLGANLSEPKGHLSAAVTALAGTDTVEVLAVSSLYATKPWGKTDQGDFLNAAVLVSTNMEPEQMLSTCLLIEHNMGRERNERWGPRNIDLDVLWWSSGEFRSEGLTIPHSELPNRAFALVPLVELVPDAQLGQQKASSVLECLPDQGVHLSEPSGWHQA